MCNSQTNTESSYILVLVASLQYDVYTIRVLVLVRVPTLDEQFGSLK